MMKLGLTRKEKEKLVVELFNQGMTHQQIAKQAHVSLRDIGPILNKEGVHQCLSNSSQAYKLFHEGVSPINVAIILNLREKDVTEYYREYWGLCHLYELHEIYEEVKESMWPFIEFYRSIKTADLSTQQVIENLKMATTLEYENRDLQGENARLEVSNQQAVKTFQQFTDLVQKDKKRLEQNHSVFSQQKREIENLNIEKTRLENLIDSIRMNNETCVKVRQIVKQEIESIVSNPKMLLRLALTSLFESSRKHPGKFQTLYYNTSSRLSVEQVLSISKNASIYGYNGDEDEKRLLDEAEQSYNRIVDAITNNCINEMPNDTELSSEMLQVPDIQNSLPPIEGNHKIFDTKDMSQVNLVYNNITFQVYPGPKITNESNNGTDVMPEEDESDI